MNYSRDPRLHLPLSFHCAMFRNLDIYIYIYPRFTWLISLNNIGGGETINQILSWRRIRCAKASWSNTRAHRARNCFLVQQTCYTLLRSLSDNVVSFVRRYAHSRTQFRNPAAVITLDCPANWTLQQKPGNPGIELFAMHDLKSTDLKSGEMANSIMYALD